MAHHEAIGPDEMFVGNTHKGQAQIDWLSSKGMKTARLGRTAYCWDGKPLSDQHKPVIIGRSEEALYDGIMMRATFGEHWKAR